MGLRNSLLVLATVLLVAVTSFAGTWLASPGKGSHASAAVATPSAAFAAANTRITYSTVSMSGTATVITMSFWINISATVQQIVCFGRNGTTGPQWYIQTTGTNEIAWRFHNSSTVVTVQGDSDPNLVNNTWAHVLFSIDTSDVAKRHIYINGVDATDTWSTYTISGTMALDRSNLYVGADDDNGGDFNGCMAQVWIDDVYTDFSNSANRAKFASGGVPVSLGTDGSTPFGAAPDVFLRFVSGSLAVNSGADGGTGTTGGTLTDGTCGTVSY